MPPTELKLPGRLGDPTMTLETDLRTNPSLLHFLKSLNMSHHLSGPMPAEDANPLSLEPQIALIAAGAHHLLDTLPLALPSDVSEPLPSRCRLSIPGVEGNQIALHLFFPPGNPEKGEEEKDGGPPPAIIYLHGGGMTINPALNRVHERWCTTLALQGAVVVLVDFRNAWVEGEGEGGAVYSPFPKGLEDCAAAVRYVHEHREELGVGKLVVQGESGGANLSLAVAIKAKRGGWGGAAGGGSAQVPYISGGHTWDDGRKGGELPSLVECDGYLISTGAQAAMVRYYAPGEEGNPLAWPYHATEGDVRGLPPHHITVAELDPLRSEGLAYHRKLLAAGVVSTASVQVGVVHAAYLFFRRVVPAEHDKEARDIVAFAKGL